MLFALIMLFILDLSVNYAYPLIRNGKPYLNNAINNLAYLSLSSKVPVTVKNL